MNKIVKLLLMVSIFMFIGCSQTSGGINPKASMSGGYELAIPLSYTKKGMVHDAIMKAGDISGWKMTEFKASSIIGEKIVGDKSASVVISFETNNIIIMKDNSTLGSDYDKYVGELIDAINKELNAQETH